VLRRIPNLYLDPSSIHISEEKSIFVVKINYYNYFNFYRYMMFSGYFNYFFHISELNPDLKQ
jgi:hypothetical protein